MPNQGNQMKEGIDKVLREISVASAIAATVSLFIPISLGIRDRFMHDIYLPSAALINGLAILVFLVAVIVGVIAAGLAVRRQSFENPKKGIVLLWLHVFFIGVLVAVTTFIGV